MKSVRGRAGRLGRGVEFVVERLEDRRVLSSLGGPAADLPVLTRGGLFNVAINGPGLERISPAGHGQVAITLFATTIDTTLTISATLPRFHQPFVPLQIASIRLISGQIGTINAPSADLNGPLTVNGTMNKVTFADINSNARLTVNGALNTINVLNNVNLGPGGFIRVGGDVTNAVDVGGSLNLDGGQFAIGRDLTGALSVTGDMTLSDGGRFVSGRDVQAINIGGNLVVSAPAGTGLFIDGNLFNLKVNGFFQGQGSPAAVDFSVGLDLGGMSILGGGANAGGLRGVNMNVNKSINALYVARGIFNSLITAGVSIVGMTVGPDGATALLDSQLLAGSQISSVTFLGDVVSNFPTSPNPGGYATRIVAGELRGGQYLPDSSVDGLVITGGLVDSVIAASVAPYGGDGTLPPPVPYGGTQRTVGSPAPGSYQTYNAPAGLTFSGASPIKNYSELTFPASGKPFVTWDTALSPVIDNTILAGGVANVIVEGGVTSTLHGPQFDFTGVLAETTQGVNGGIA